MKKIILICIIVIVGVSSANVALKKSASGGSLWDSQRRMEILQIQRRVFGGEFAKENQFTHQAALMYRGRFHCGGSIISPSVILTAGHCLVDDPSSLEILAGTIELKSENGERRKVLQQIKHEKYMLSEEPIFILENDIGLLVLDEPLEFSESIQPIKLETEELEIDSHVTIIGWGRSNENPEGESNRLKFNRGITIYSNDGDGCASFKNDGIVCLGHIEGNGACHVSFTNIYDVYLNNKYYFHFRETQVAVQSKMIQLLEL